MSCRLVRLIAGCWVLAGGISLIAYAIFAELTAFLTGKQGKPLETSTAREIAHRMSSVYGVKARASRRHPFS